MRNRIPMLRVKIASLAAEARIIRQKERACRRNQRLVTELSEHRRGIVRSEARAAQLASGFLRGREYRSMEPACRPGHEPDWARVWQLVEKYGACYDWDAEIRPEYDGRVDQQRDDFVQWMARATAVAA